MPDVPVTKKKPAETKDPDAYPFEPLNVPISPAKKPRQMDPLWFVKALVNQGLKMQQARASRAIQLGFEIGVPIDIADRNLEQLESISKQKGFNAERFRDHDPVLEQMYAEHPSWVSVYGPEQRKLKKLRESFYRADDIRRPRTDAEIEQSVRKAINRDAIVLSNSFDEGPAYTTNERLYQDAVLYEKELDQYVASNKPIDTLEHLGRRLKGNGVFYIPFLGGVMDLTSAANLYIAARAMESDSASPEQGALLVTAARLEEAAARRGKTFIAGAAKILSESTPYALEFLFTSGLYPLGKSLVIRGTGELAEAFTKRMAKRALAKYVARGATALGKVAERVGGVALHAAASPQRMALGIVRRITPDGGLESAEDGSVRYRVNKGSGESLWAAIPKAAYESFVEFGSERTGKIFQIFEDPVLRKVFGIWSKGKPGRTAEALQTLMARAGFNGVLGEISEEEIGEMMRAVGGQFWLSDVDHYSLPLTEGGTTGRELAQQALAFGAPIAGAAAVDVAERMMRDQEKSEASAKMLAEISKKANAIELATSHPEALAAYAEGAASDAGTPTVSISAKSFNQYFAGLTTASGNPLDPEAVARSLLGEDGMSAYLDATENDGDIQVPMSAYVARIATSEHAKFFEQNARIDPMNMSAAESEEFAKAAIDKESATEDERKTKAAERKKARDERPKTQEELRTEARQKEVDDYASYLARQVDGREEATPATRIAAQSMGRLAQMAGVSLSEINQEFGIYIRDQSRAAAEAEVPAPVVAPQQPIGADPLTVYHGTTASDIESFDLEDTKPEFDMGIGTFFSSRPSEAGFFVQEPTDLIGGRSDKFSSGANIIPAYVSIKNPKVYETQADYVAAIHESKYDRRGQGFALREELEQDGYDGIIIKDSQLDGKDVEGGKRVIAFHPEQIKSAISNRGTFDPKDPNIFYQKEKQSDIVPDAQESPDGRTFYQKHPDSIMKDGEWYYSKLYRAAQELPEVFTLAEFNSMLKAVKKSEQHWMGIESFRKRHFQGKDLQFRDNLLQFLDNMAIKLEDIRLVGNEVDQDTLDKLIDDARTQYHWYRRKVLSLEYKEKARENFTDNEEQIDRLGDAIEKLRAEIHSRPVPEIGDQWSQREMDILTDNLDGHENALYELQERGKDLEQRVREVPADVAEEWDYLIESEFESNYSAHYDDALEVAKENGGGVDAPEFEEYMKLRYSDREDYMEFLVTFKAGTHRRLQSLDFAEFTGGHHQKDRGPVFHFIASSYVRDGQKLLYIHEVQSDWASASSVGGVQKFAGEEVTSQDIDKYVGNLGGRIVDTHGGIRYRLGGEISEIYKSEAEATLGMQHSAWMAIEASTRNVPRAPFIEKFGQWTELAVKRILSYAAQNNFDRVLFSYGDTVSDRYNLRVVANKISYNSSRHELLAFPADGSAPRDYVVPPHKIHNYVGASVVKALSEAEVSSDGVAMVTLADVEVNARPMRSAYDEVLVNAFNDAMKPHGVRVEDYALGGIRGESRMKPEMTHSVVLEKKTATEIATRGFPLFQGGVSPAPLARVMFEKGKAIIDLFRGANKSSIIHETAHVYLEALTSLATRPDATDEVRRQFNSIIEWLGPLTDGRFTEEQHEKFAEGFMRYVMEGHAPSRGLRKAFARMRVWMLELYAVARGLFGSEISPEVRRIFDRMLATEREIDEVKREEGYGALITDMSGTSKEFRERYATLSEEAEEHVRAKVTEEALADIRAESKQWWKDESEKLRADAEKRVDSIPIYRAIRYLRTGQAGDTALPEGTPHLKLSRDEVRRIYADSRGESDLWIGAKAFADRIRFATGTKTAPVGVIAGWFGFSSPIDFLNALADAEPRETVVQNNIREQMQIRHGEPPTEEAMQESARKHYHNHAQSELRLMEMRYIYDRKSAEVKKAIGTVNRLRGLPQLGAVRRQAEAAILPLILGKMNPRTYLGSERRAARAAEAALAKEDHDAAIKATQRRLVNGERYRAAVAALDTVERFLKSIKVLRKSDKKLSKTRDISMVAAARAVLAAYGIGKFTNSPDSYLSQIKTVDEEQHRALSEMVAAATAGADPSAGLDGITYEKFLEIKQVVESLMELAVTNKQIEIDGKRVAIGEVRAELVEGAAVFAGKPHPARALTKWEKLKSRLLGVGSFFRIVNSWADMMDLGSANGPFKRAISRKVGKATARYKEERVKYHGKLQAIFQTLKGRMFYSEIKAPELGTGYTFNGMSPLLHAMLHMGNESNARRMILGGQAGSGPWGEEKEDGKVDRTAWNSFINRLVREGILTKEHFDAVQSIWDLLEEMKPAAQRAHRQRFGHYFLEVTRDEVDTPFGKYPGGYVPAKTDPMQVSEAQIHGAKSEIEDEDSFSIFPQPGFTKKRTENYARPLLLDASSLGMHIDQVLKFSYIAPHVAEIGRLILHRDFTDAMQDANKSAIREMLVPWLKRAGNQKDHQVRGEAMRAIATVARYFYRNSGMQMMVGNLSNAMQQLTGLSIAAIKVKPRFLTAAMLRFMQDPRSFAKDVTDRSLFMRNISSAQVADMQSQIRDILLNENIYQKTKRYTDQHGAILQNIFQNIVNYITWGGAYDEAIEAGHSEDAAVDIADEKVKLTQGTGATEDKAEYTSQNDFVKFFTLFQTYWNMLANLHATEVMIVRKTVGLKHGAGRLFYVYMLGFAMVAAISEAIMIAASGGPDDDDGDGDRDWGSAFFDILFGAQGDMLIAMTPLGSAIRYAVHAYTDNPKRFYNDSIVVSPAIGVLESSITAPLDMYKKLADEDDKQKSGRVTRDAITALGFWTGIPTGFIGKGVGYAVGVESEEIEPTGPIDYIRGVTTGKK